MSDGFERHQDELFCEDQSLNQLAEHHGTPLYVYSQSHFLNRYRAFEQALSDVDHMICFAMKCNGNLAVLNRLAEAGCGFDIVSGGELRRVLEAGGDPGKVVYAGVAKTAEEQKLALEKGIDTFNVESRPELDQLNQIAGQMDETARVALRVNPNVDAKTHEKITTGKTENKFGIPIALIEDYASFAQEADHIDLAGLHFHIGSQITDREPFEQVTDRAVSLVEELREDGHEIRDLNLGGGLGVQYRDEQTLSPEDWAEVVVPKVQDLDVRLIVEPGRFIMANAGVLLTRTNYIKESVTKNFVIVDAGMHTLIRPAMYDAYHEIEPVVYKDRELITADIVGPICETGDTLGADRTIERPEPGDYLAIRSAGAYGFVMASQYNAFPRPAEILVDGDSARVVRERESFDDLIRGETT